MKVYVLLSIIVIKILLEVVQTNATKQSLFYIVTETV